MNIPKRKAIAGSVLLGVLGYVVIRQYMAWSDSLADDLHYRGYTTRFLASLVERVHQDDRNPELRSELADVFYGCGYYQEAGVLYRDADILSHGNNASLKEKMDACRWEFLWNGGDRPDANKVDAGVVSRLVW